MLLSLLLSIAVGHAGIDEEPEEPDAPSRIEGSLPRFQNMSPREQRSRALGGIEVVAGGAFFGALAAEGIRVSLNPFTASNGAWAASKTTGSVRLGVQTTMYGKSRRFAHVVDRENTS